MPWERGCSCSSETRNANSMGNFIVTACNLSTSFLGKLIDEGVTRIEDEENVTEDLLVEYGLTKTQCTRISRHFKLHKASQNKPTTKAMPVEQPDAKEVRPGLPKDSNKKAPDSEELAVKKIEPETVHVQLGYGFFNKMGGPKLTRPKTDLYHSTRDQGPNNLKQKLPHDFILQMCQAKFEKFKNKRTGGLD